MIDGIVFDKDGTLFDFRVSWGRWAEGFLAGLARDENHAGQMAEAIGFLPAERSFRPDSVVIAATAADIAATLLPHLPGRDLGALREAIDEAAAGVAMAEAVPLVPLLTALRARGLRLGVATNDSEAPARAHLAAHGLTGLLDFIAGYDSGYGPKPGPGMCRAFAVSQGLEPGRVLMVGDSRHDLEAGRAAGMRTIAVLTGIATAADLAPLAEAVLPDIGALPALLDRLQA
ncbi:HAD family hydrolase [Rhodobacter sp. Har01]|uniref:HAD family hydrolase n=1 Tax=Rhodobacter sp. Har01 TaxID=2883999 RepID=UPI001D071DEA|nr:HAD family hydrolase [Rhodobacter sp. Har01]MCB6178349.1 HAD family hydrolase [Rhodobacter sp. Har01]